MSPLVFQSAGQLAANIRDRRCSAVEVLEAYLQQIERHNPALNAIVSLDAERAYLRAKAADAALAAGEDWGPLHGVPVTIKDIFETAGLRTTYSYPPLADYVPRQDATVVARLLAAGAIILGKTNLPPRGTDFQTASPVFGRTNNPWCLDRTPGGSTGGGGAAIAAGLSPLELGNDLAGSLRIPAHFCGVYALKPTEQRLSNGFQMQPRGLRHMLVTGPLARSIADLRLCLTVLENTGTSSAVAVNREIPPPHRSLSDLRIAWCDRLGPLVADRQTQAALQQVALQLEAAGCRVENRAPQFNMEALWQTYGQLCTAQLAPLENAVLRVIARGMAQSIPERWLPGGALVKGFTQGISLTLTDYLQSLNRRDGFIRQLDQFLADWDAWICPVTPGPAFIHRSTRSWLRRDLNVDDLAVPYWLWGFGFTSIFNLTGNPVVAMPITQTTAGLPIGLQLVGKRWHDLDLLAIAEAVSTVTDGFVPPPGYG